MTWFVNIVNFQNLDSGCRCADVRGAIKLRNRLAAGLLLFATWLSAVASDATASTFANIDAGKRIYREGRLTSGDAMRAIGQGGVVLTGKQAACVNCHRRSGLGSYEGGKPVRPITAPELFADRALVNVANVQTQKDRSGVRPAYDDQTLLNALTKGVDSRGRTLDALMPHYELNKADFAALYAYLKTLSAAATPGVTASEIHFATIIGADVDAKKRTALLDVLNGYITDKNSESRLDTRRAQQALHSRERMYERYRKWVLHVWELNGDESSWPAQLQSYYQSQAVFAVLGGTVGGSWARIHAFCEQAEVPCVFPDTDLPALGNTDFYTLYFSQGRALDGRVVAARLRNASGSTAGEVVQVYRDRPSDDIEAKALRADLAGRETINLRDYAVSGKMPLTPEFWRSLFNESHPETLILWLGAEDLPDFAAVSKLAQRPVRIFLSGRRVDAGHVGDAPDGGVDVYLIFPYELPSVRNKKLQRMRAWMRVRKIDMTDDILQSNTFFTLAISGEILKHMPPDFSREYFIERIEDMTESTPISSAFHNASLGPYQRYASKGEYVVRLARKNGVDRFADATWVVP